MFDWIILLTAYLALLLRLLILWISTGGSRKEQ